MSLFTQNCGALSFMRGAKYTSDCPEALGKGSSIMRKKLESPLFNEIIALALLCLVTKFNLCDFKLSHCTHLNLVIAGP